jgi:hypothetical protein
MTISRKQLDEVFSISICAYAVMSPVGRLHNSEGDAVRGSREVNARSAITQCWHAQR